MLHVVDLAADLIQLLGGGLQRSLELAVGVFRPLVDPRRVHSPDAPVLRHDDTPVGHESEHQGRVDVAVATTYAILMWYL